MNLKKEDSETPNLEDPTNLKEKKAKQEPKKPEKRRPRAFRTKIVMANLLDQSDCESDVEPENVSIKKICSESTKTVKKLYKRREIMNNKGKTSYWGGKRGLLPDFNESEGGEGLDEIRQEATQEIWVDQNIASVGNLFLRNDTPLNNIMSQKEKKVKFTRSAMLRQEEMNGKFMDYLNKMKAEDYMFKGGKSMSVSPFCRLSNRPSLFKKKYGTLFKFFDDDVHYPTVIKSTSRGKKSRNQEDVKHKAESMPNKRRPILNRNVPIFERKSPMFPRIPALNRIQMPMSYYNIPNRIPLYFPCNAMTSYPSVPTQFFHNMNYKMPNLNFEFSSNLISRKKKSRCFDSIGKSCFDENAGEKADLSQEDPNFEENLSMQNQKQKRLEFNAEQKKILKNRVINKEWEETMEVAPREDKSSP